MYGWESWTIKKAEPRRIDAFELWCWRRLGRVPWTARRSNQSILKEISPEYSLQGLMLKLKLQCFGHLMQTTDSLEKTLMLGKIEEEKGMTEDDGWMASLTQWTWVWVGSRSWWWTGRPGVLQSMGSQRVGHNWATELNPISWNCVSRSQPIPLHTTEPWGLMGCQLYSDIYLQGSFWCLGTWNQKMVSISLPSTFSSPYIVISATSIFHKSPEEDNSSISLHTQQLDISCS